MKTNKELTFKELKDIKEKARQEHSLMSELTFEEQTIQLSFNEGRIEEKQRLIEEFKEMIKSLRDIIINAEQSGYINDEQIDLREIIDQDIINKLNKLEKEE